MAVLFVNLENGDMGNELAISVIKEHAQEEKLDKMEQIVLTCEFITKLDKDADFKKFLIDKKFPEQ